MCSSAFEMQGRRLMGRYPLMYEGSPPDCRTTMAFATYQEGGTWQRRRDAENNVKDIGAKRSHIVRGPQMEFHQALEPSMGWQRK